jgi:hypothetical protein
LIERKYASLSIAFSIFSRDVVFKCTCASIKGLIISSSLSNFIQIIGIQSNFPNNEDDLSQKNSVIDV